MMFDIHEWFLSGVSSTIQLMTFRNLGKKVIVGFQYWKVIRFRKSYVMYKFFCINFHPLRITSLIFGTLIDKTKSGIVFFGKFLASYHGKGVISEIGIARK